MATDRYLKAGEAVTLSAATFLVLGSSGTEHSGAWLVELRPTGATYSITFKGRLAADPVTGDAALAYTNLTTGATTSGATPLTGTTSSVAVLLRVVSDGLKVALDLGTLSAGTMDVIARPVNGER
jgi:hypothetical protein